MKQAPLNHKQKKFALEYRKDHNGTQAALRAGYSHRGADVQAVRLLADERIRKLIDVADEKALAKVEADGNKVLTELGHLGFADPIGVFTTEGVLKHLEDMKPEVRRTIKSLEFEELFEGADGEKFVKGRLVKISFWDKVKSLDLLGRNQALWKNVVEHKADESLAELLALARKPAAPGEDDE